MCPLKLVKKCPKVVPAPRLVNVELNPGPRSGQHLSEEQKWGVINQWKVDKLGAKSISKKMKISLKSVKNIIRKYKETNSIATRPGQGRKRKLSRTEVGKIKKKAKTGKSAKTLAQEESKKLGKPISETTIRRELKASGLKYLGKEEREELTASQMAKRISFATTRMDYNWRNVLFTDEKSFWIGSEEEKAWQDPSHRTVRYTRRYAPKIHVWAGITLPISYQLIIYRYWPLVQDEAVLLRAEFGQRALPNYLECEDSSRLCH